MDILVYTRSEALEKKLDPNNVVAFCDLAGVPRQTDHCDIERIYFATKGAIRGHCEIDEVYYERITFIPSTWSEFANPIPHHQFQGFKYVRGDLKQKIEKED